MAWVEDVSKRGRKEKHYRDSVSGQWMAEFKIDDIHYRDDVNAWAEVNEVLVDDTSIPGLSKKCDQCQHKIYLGNGGERRWYPRRNVSTEYVSITDIQYWTTQGGGSWRNLNLPTPVWSGNGASWDMTNLSAALVNTWHQIKTSFVLKNSAAPTRLRFEISFTGLTLDTNTWEVKSGSTVVGYIPPPVFTDALDVNVPVTTTYAGGYIEWSVDPTGATYPLTSHSVTFTDGYGGDATTYFDTELRAAAPSTNYGTATTMYILSASAGPRRSIVSYDLSSIDDGVTIDSGTLSLWNAATHTANLDFAAYSILVANTGITEAGATWATKDGSNRWAGDADPAGGSDAGCSQAGTDYNASAMGTWTYIANTVANTQHDITLNTTQVAAWLTANYGAVLAMTTADTNLNFSWHTSDSATTGYRPKLVILYTEAGGDLTIQDGSHTHSAENVVLTQVHNLTVQDGSHTHSAENVVLTITYNLAVQDGVHTHTADNVVLVIAVNLTVQDGEHTHTADNVVLTQVHNIAIQDGQHTHTAENVVLTQVHNLSVQDGEHTHTADNAVLTGGYALSVQDGVHTHTADNIVLTQVHNLSVQDGVHTHTADNVTLTASFTLVVQDGQHTHAADNAVVTETSMVYMRPSADVTDGNWTNELGTQVNLYDSINEVVPDDNDYMQSEVSPVYSPVVVKLSNGSDPFTDSDHTIIIRYNKEPSDTPDTIVALIELRQSYVNESNMGTLIADWVDSDTSTTMTTFYLTLSEAEAGNISDYTALFVRIVANPGEFLMIADGSHGSEAGF